MNMTEIAIDAIKIDGGTQARVSINEGAVAEYAEAMTEGEAPPPVVVFFDGADYFLADGFHRYHANRRIGARTLAADVRTGTLAGAKLFAYGANRGHGLRRTNEDKRKAVAGMLANFADWSDNRIAKHVGVDHKTVAAHRVSILGVSQDAPATRTAERSGKTYTQDVSGQQQAAKERAKPTPTMQAEEPELQEPPAPPKQGAVGDTVESLRIQLDAANDTIAELSDSLKGTVNDNNAMAAVFDADDKLAEALKENQRLRAEVAGLRERIHGLMNEKNSAIRQVKYWRRRAEAAEKAAAA